MLTFHPELSDPWVSTDLVYKALKTDRKRKRMRKERERRHKADSNENICIKKH